MYSTCIPSHHLDICQCQYHFVVVSSLSYACPHVLSAPSLAHAPTGLCSFLHLDCCWFSLGARRPNPPRTVMPIVCQLVCLLRLGYSFPQSPHSSPHSPLYIHSLPLRADLPYACSPFCLSHHHVHTPTTAHASPFPPRLWRALVASSSSTNLVSRTRPTPP